MEPLPPVHAFEPQKGIIMTKFLLVAGAAALAFTVPAAAQPDHDKGKHGKVHQGRITANAWGRSCPPGLAKKNNGCRPPGIAKQRFKIGDRWSGNYRAWSFNQVPLDWRRQYDLDSSNRYYYRDGYLYSVDPRTRVVESIVRALIN